PKLHETILDENDRFLIEELDKCRIRVEDLLEHYKFREALYEVIDLSRKGNQYLQKKEPWKKGASEDTDNTLHVCLQLCANLAILVNPFLPNTAKKMLHMMKVVEKVLD